ncbi:MAG: dihydrodipicolinate synthase family protein [Chloroflexi bacterium]|nr:dihydrodipicolinate synthase family protein [Chloroflexota bacterium]
MQRQVDWQGIFPAVLTIFDRSGRIDDTAMATHIDRLVNEGATGLVVGGTSGEFILLDDVERVRVIEIAVAAAGGRVPVIAGTGYASTAQTVSVTRRAAAIGADGAIVILPYFLRPTEPEVMDHFAAVGRASPIPVMLYNNPANSAAPALEVPRIHALFAAGLLQAVKSTFPTVHEVHELRAELPPEFRVFYGSFMAPLEALAGGADGWISGILNVATPDAVAMRRAMCVGDLDGARAAWRRILPIKLLYTRQQVGPAGDLPIYRAILHLRGLEGGASRSPVHDLSTDQVRVVRELLHPIGLVP